MPPPMCVARVIMPSTAVAVAVSDCSKREDEAIAAVMSDGRLALVRSVEADLWEETMQVGVHRQNKFNIRQHLP